MSDTSFFAAAARSDALRRLQSTRPGDPFCTDAYIAAKEATGRKCWVLGCERSHGAVVAGCCVFVRHKWLESSLDMPSVPALPSEDPFWLGFQRFCSDQGAVRAGIHSFGSPEGAQIPAFAGETRRRTRTEFVLPLEGDLQARLDAKHRRELRRAESESVEIRKVEGGAGLDSHLASIAASMDRRRDRGEAVPDSHEGDHKHLIATGALEIYQALRSGEVLSSAAVLVAPNAGYLYTTGTSPAGMSAGASHLLVYSIARILKTRGAERFVLGGAEVGSGLARFKVRFGAFAIELPEVETYVGSRYRWRIYRTVRNAKDALRRVLR
jgi:hypothetical protein